MAFDKPRSDWTCTFCVHSRSGNPWRNNGTVLYCGKCRVAKGTALGKTIGPSSPEVPRRAKNNKGNI
eukprot:4497852-Lingulodinium_polyedra.AAC.1